LIVEEGAILEGSCTMVQARQTQEDDDARPQEDAYAEPEPAQSSLISMSDDDYLPADDDEESADAASV
jgi:hypothetical protein